jgi:hypothetical protein
LNLTSGGIASMCCRHPRPAAERIGPMMRVPSWYGRVKRHPDYNDDRVILVDSMVFFAMVRGDWDDELSFVVNCPHTMLRIKLNQQLLRETIGLGAQGGVGAGRYQRQREFIDIYRRNGKILIDDGNVPFFAIGRLNLYQEVSNAMRKTNISAEDLPTVVDAIVNRIPLLTWEDNLPKGIASALRNREVVKVLKSGQLWTEPGEVLLGY